MLNTADSMKAKLIWLLKQSGHVTSADLQAATGLKTASGVSEWLRTGRIDKRHIPTLARLSGISERWWLTPDAPIPPTGEWATARAKSASPVHAGRASLVAFPQTQAWPFKFDRARFDRLSQRDKDRVEGAALNIVIECERGTPKRTKSGGAA